MPLFRFFPLLPRLGFLIGLFACAQPEPFLLKTRSLPLEIPEAHLLHWPYERLMLIQSRSGFVLIDPESRSIVANLNDRHKKLSWLDFFTDTGGVFSLEGGGHVWIQNWQSPGGAQILDPKDYESLRAQNETRPVGERYPPGVEPGGRGRPITMGLRSTRDSGRKVALWYVNPHFDADPGQWKLTLWSLLDSGKIESKRELPAGPWVYEHGFWKQMKCFSCGCSCYEHVALKSSQGQVFLSVTGVAVEEEHAGIYVISEDPRGSARWIRIVPGQVQHFAVSPGGNTVAFIQNRQLIFTTIAKK